MFPYILCFLNFSSTSYKTRLKSNNSLTLKEYFVYTSPFNYLLFQCYAKLIHPFLTMFSQFRRWFSTEMDETVVQLSPPFPQEETAPSLWFARLLRCTPVSTGGRGACAIWRRHLLRHILHRYKYCIIIIPTIIPYYIAINISKQ